MNVKMILTAAALAVGLTAGADVTVKLPEGSTLGELEIEKGLISALATQKRGETVSMKEKVPVKDGTARITALGDGDAQYVIPFGDRQYAIVYAAPGDEVTVDVTSEKPLVYTVSGNALMEGISGMDRSARLQLETFRTEQTAETPDPARLEQIEKDYYGVYTGFMTANPTHPAAAYALLHLEGEDFIKGYEALSPEARKSPLMPLVEAQRSYVEKALAAERRKAELQSGTVDAPDFTFKDKDGKDVSLSQYKGKWVIIDFWGSWCRWCIKGFPSLKEAYAKYQPKLEVIGVACNDSPQAWENALTKYALPWVNVYNPEQGGGKVLEEYAVQGFPTKVIVDPQGKIRNITSGDNPAFYEVLDKLLK